jgi:hypothetical protein
VRGAFSYEAFEPVAFVCPTPVIVLGAVVFKAFDKISFTVHVRAVYVYLLCAVYDGKGYRHEKG